MRLVMKFGGSSLASGARIAQAAEIIQSERLDDREITVVVSALAGVTDALVQAATSAAAGDGETYGRIRQALQNLHREALEPPLADPATCRQLMADMEQRLENFEGLCRSIHVLGELTPRALDLVSSIGERFSAQMLAAALRQRGVAAQSVIASELIVTDDTFGAAVPLMEPTRQQARARLEPLLTAATVPVVTGFLAATPAGLITTLGRGGSDYSATILGSALDADEIWIWTDVNGVLTADPRIVPEAQTLAEISYAEAAELAYYGAKVLHPRTIQPAVERGITLRIRNSFAPTHPGTRITARPQAPTQPVRAISAIRDLSQVTVEGSGMLGVPGVAGRVFSAVAREKISVLMISQSSSEHSICFVIPRAAAADAIRALECEFELEIARHQIDRIWSDDQIGIVAVVGAGMRGVPGIAGKVFGALGRSQINILSIAQGSSEHNLSFVLADRDADEAVRQIHREFDLGRPTGGAAPAWSGRGGLPA